MDPINTAIINALRVNMGYQSGEEVVIILQRWGKDLGGDTREAFAKSDMLATRMHDVLGAEGIAVRLIDYVPEEAGHGVDAPKDIDEAVGNPSIVFMPTAYSLTHTRFRNALTEKSARVASMPTFTLDMFDEGGPMSVDSAQVHKDTERVAEQLRSGRYVRITGQDTDIIVEVDLDLVAISSGLMTNPGDYGNLPGAEAYAVPVHNGNSNGHITVPVGWGGASPLEHATTFFVQSGRFVRAKGDSTAAQAYIDREVKPHLFSQPDFNVLAELGIGTNPNVTESYIAKHGWSPLTAEKISGSAHFANGNSKSMGGKNDVPKHIDWVVPGVRIDFNYPL